MHLRKLVPWTLISVIFGAAFFLAPLSAEDAASVREQFKQPPREYATAPLWVWNDMLTEAQVRGTLRDLAGQNVKQAFVHPRPGLMTPYLSDEWFRLWKAALDEAEKLDMNVWIYDENSYPSGFAGGWVPEIMPESRGRGLQLSETAQLEKPGPNVIAQFRLTDGGYEKVNAVNNGSQAAEKGKYLVASVVRAGNSPWHGDRCYVDLMYPGVTEKFLDVTLDPYRRHFGAQFGKRIPGSFTDEPNIAPADGLPWTDHLPEAFQKRWGYSLLDHLPSLTRPLGDWKKVRHDYFQVLLDQYIEHWAKPYSEYCEKHGLEFTGHYWEHSWPDCVGVPDNMAMYAWHQRPAIDCLCNQYAENTHAQFGNVRMVKELSSAANQLGRKRTLCETYGAGGWDLRFEDMKRIGDWVSVLGVNTIDEHLSYITLRGARKRDHPQSLSYHEPWWEAYHVMEDYFTRLSLVLSSGEEINKILVIEPTTTAWMYQADPSQGGKLAEVGDRFFDLCLALSKNQVEYDIGCEDIIARHGSITEKTDRPEQSRPRACFTVGKRNYHTVVLPPMTETLNEKTMQLLEDFAKRGGRILCCGQPPAMVDARLSPRGKTLADSRGWKQLDPPALVELLGERPDNEFSFHFSPVVIDQTVYTKDPQMILFHQRRQTADGQFLFLANTNPTHRAIGHILTALRTVEKWDPFTGTAKPYRYSVIDEKGHPRIETAFDLAPGESLLLRFSPPKPIDEVKKSAWQFNPLAPPPVIPPQSLQPLAPPEIVRLEPNVLTLDYVDVTAGGETLKNAYFYRANQFAFQKNGLPRNPWDSAVQFRDELIKHKFPADSGFTAAYHFKIAEKVPTGLEIVIERPDLYAIECNGKPVAATKDAWWLDKAFGRIDLSKTAQVGENAVTIRARPMTLYHEIEPAYLLGDFNLKPAMFGFVVVPPRPLTLGDNALHGQTPDGTMWLTSGVNFPGAAKSDAAPFVVFDLGQEIKLAGLNVWNYNETNLTNRGAMEIRLSGSTTGKPNSFTIPLGDKKLKQATGKPQFVEIDAAPVRFVRLDVLSNHNGVKFPAEDGRIDNAFTGLGEVQFLAAGAGGKPKIVPDVKIAAVSSELTSTSFNRRANFLLGGSGLDAEGWNSQGLPFYSAGVAYREQFDLPEPKGPYSVRLPRWYGSVAKINVNGKPAGYITHQPWQCDVTKFLKPGKNEIEVVVVGTLKNTLGPHHIGAVRGSAWPSMFQQGPEAGPPRGERYDTIGYGLFEPFVLEQQ